MGAIEDKFRTRTPKSAELAERAAWVIPGGETRSAVYHPPYSVVVDHASGPRVYDSGSEGVQSALAIGRGYNGRSKLLVSTYAYHGHFIDTARYLTGDTDTPDFVGTRKWPSRSPASMPPSPSPPQTMASPTAVGAWVHS